MKLAALGVATLGIGAILGIPGLIGIGAWWVVIGYFARREAASLKTIGTAGKGGAPVDGRTFARGTLLWIALGVPSLAVGILELGIDADHERWRLLPLIVGGLALGVGVLGAGLYLAGSAVVAASDGGTTTPTHPATLWIKAMKETGTFINERPRLEFELRVEPEAGAGLAAYDVTKKATVPYTALGSLRVGDGFKALVAGPEDPTSMEIHWDQPVEGG